ncbi:MAG TPA: AraC family transcriptional regulator, partial [Cytophagaceae bacterium]
QKTSKWVQEKNDSLFKDSFHDYTITVIFFKMQLSVKNMVCNRCIKVVKEELEKLGLEIIHIQLGEVTIAQEPSEVDIDAIKTSLKDNGFELLDDKKALLITKIKSVVIETFHQKNQIDLQINFSHILEQKVGKDYHFLSTLFSSMEGFTIEKYVINQKIERVKELLIYDEMNLSEIAIKMGYSSVQHLSTQFKKITGFTPSDFRKLNDHNRKALDEV